MQSLHMCSCESGQDELLKGITDNMVLNSETEDGTKLKEDLCKQNANLVAASRVGKSVFVFMESEYRSDNGIFWGQYCEQDVWNNFLGLTQASWTVFRLWIANETHHA